MKKRNRNGVAPDKALIEPGLAPASHTRGAMKRILDFPTEASRAVIWALGQAGYIIRSCGKTIVIDPYLSDSAAGPEEKYGRIMPVPIRPEDLFADIFMATHDHLDHLDPDTVGPYRHKGRTTFVAPRLACRKLYELGVPARNIVRVDSGEDREVEGIRVSGTYAVPTEPRVIDTTGYALQFPNGRTLCHTSDTAWSDLILKTTPCAEVLLVAINGKWGNLTVDQAAALAARVAPKIAIPMHYDMMALNSADPAHFKRVLRARNPALAVKILKVLMPFTW
ncbi:MAG: MBL fold metallo-hydrolase [Kiritimatiellae bacterium]|nr:MBL fold metallo-hydrolase [Kiritimatiellia bacterium]